MNHEPLYDIILATSPVRLSRSASVYKWPKAYASGPATSALLQLLRRCASTPLLWTVADPSKTRPAL
eukprot:1164052-Amphidinium_carterae.2